jgi:hypothetical protein
MDKADQGDTWDAGPLRMSNVVTCTCRSSEDLKEAFEDLADRGALFGIVSQWTVSLHHNATSWDNGCQKRPLLTPFLTPVAPRRARDRVPSILALGLFLPVSDFTQPENGLPTSPLPFHMPVVTKPQVTVQK